MISADGVISPMGDSPMRDAIRAMWSLGDYGALAVHLEPHAIELAQRRRLQAGSEVLDVAAGNGNFAIAAARLGATVVATDLTPAMVELARTRTREEGLAIEWLDADAEASPFPMKCFDVVASVFGEPSAPDPDRVAAELFRATRPGGLVAMANYGPKGFLPRFTALMATRASGATAGPADHPLLGRDRRAPQAVQGTYSQDRGVPAGPHLRVRLARRRLGVLGADQPTRVGLEADAAP